MVGKTLLYKLIGIALVSVLTFVVPLHWHTGHAIVDRDTDTLVVVNRTGDHVKTPCHQGHSDSVPSSTPVSGHTHGSCLFCHFMAGLYSPPDARLLCVEQPYLNLLISLPQAICTGRDVLTQSQPRAPPVC